MQHQRSRASVTPWERLWERQCLRTVSAASTGKAFDSRPVPSATARTCFTRQVMPSGLFRYASAASGKQYLDFAVALIAPASSSRSIFRALLCSGSGKTST